MHLLAELALKTRICIPAILVLFLLPVCVAQDDPPGGNPFSRITVQAGKTLEDDVFSFNKDVYVMGEVQGSVGTISSDIHVSGLVRGNLSVLGGSVTLTSGAVIEGNVVVLGGRLKQVAGATIQGKPIHFFDPDKQNKAGGLSTKAKLSWFFFLNAICFLLVIAVFYTVPNQVNEAGFELSQDLVRNVIMGGATLGAFLLAFFFSILLMALVVGIILFFIVAVVFTVIQTFGIVVVFYRLAQMLRELGGQRISLVVSTFVAVLVISLLLLVPWVRVAVAVSLMILGSGIVVSTRFGTNKSWFTRKSKFWAAS